MNQLRIGAEVSAHGTSSIFRATLGKNRLFVKLISKRFNSSANIDRHCSLLQWFSFFNMVQVNRVYDDGDVRVIEMPMGKYPFDIISDECTISETNAIALLFCFLQAIKRQGKLFYDQIDASSNNDIPKLASSICALVSGCYTSDPKPGKPLSTRTVLEYSRNSLQKGFNELLHAMLAEDETQRPDVHQCLEAPVFQHPRARHAIQDLQNRIGPIEIPQGISIHNGRPTPAQAAA